MSANANPRFPQKANLGTPVPITAANTKSDGAGTIGTDIFLALTAGADGSLVEYVRFNPTASVAATTTNATTARVFWSTAVSGAVTSANTHLIGEVNLPASSADHSTNPTNPIDLPVQMWIPANATILVTNHVAPAANTAWKAMVVAGDF